MRTCTDCGAPLPAPHSSGRPRTKCEACSPTRARDTRRRAPHKLAPADLVTLPAPSVQAGIVEATTRTLAEAGRLDSVAGQTALLLAQQLATGAHSGAGYAALAKQLLAAMDAACEGAVVAQDPVDELRRKRDKRA